MFVTTEDLLDSRSGSGVEVTKTYEPNMPKYTSRVPRYDTVALPTITRTQ